MGILISPALASVVKFQFYYKACDKKMASPFKYLGTFEVKFDASRAWIKEAIAF